MIERILSYLMSGPHPIDWQCVGGLGIILAAVWVWSSCRLAARSLPLPPKQGKAYWVSRDL